MMQEEIEKSEGEEVLSGKIVSSHLTSLIQKLQQENKLSIINTSESDYIPVRGTWHIQNSTEDFDLDEHVDQFLRSEKKYYCS